MESSITLVKDFRNSSYTTYDFNLGDKKEKFINEFRKTHPRAQNIYLSIKNKQGFFNKSFRSIYFEKCVYCGINTQVIDSSKFEVDHFIPESILKAEMGFEYSYINGIENLVNSCQMCNRNKSDFMTDDENRQLLHPDNNNLPTIFERIDDYSIEVSNEYINNNEILRFYMTLNLDNQLRRLDYLIMEMKDFCDKYQTESIVNDIQRLILKIESKRRRNY